MGARPRLRTTIELASQANLILNGQSSKICGVYGMTNDENLLIDSDHGLRSKSILFSDSGYGCNRAPTEETPEKRYIEPEILSV